MWTASDLLHSVAEFEYLAEGTGLRKGLFTRQWFRPEGKLWSASEVPHLQSRSDLFSSESIIAAARTWLLITH